MGRIETDEVPVAETVGPSVKSLVPDKTARELGPSWAILAEVFRRRSLRHRETAAYRRALITSPTASDPISVVRTLAIISH